ncbi:MAG: HupE/UreJ family protein [Pseudomonadota bacterium]
MPAGWIRCIGIAVFLLCSGAQAHLLNMTRVDVAVARDSPGTLRVTIDLGQSLLSAQAYWSLVQELDPTRRTQRLSPIVRELESALDVRVAGVSLPLTFLEAALAADSLAAIQNPLTPQFATLSWALPPVVDAAALTLALDDSVDVPWPLVVRLDSSQRTLPVSAVLTDDRRQTQQLPLTDTDSAAAGNEPVATLFGVYALIGFEHILPLGTDHVLFVLGLALIGGSLRALIGLVTTFTVAHSLTLALATLGVLTVPAAITEPLIAASIVGVGLERLLRPPNPRAPGKRLELRIGLVFAVGLLHGLGFASALGAVGLPTGQRALALFSFNIGVEAAQLVVLVAAVATLRVFERFRWYETCIAVPAATLVAGIGLYWLIDRVGLLS